MDERAPLVRQRKVRRNIAFVDHANPFSHRYTKNFLPT